MGFLSAMKGANNAWGTIICADGIGTIGPENFIKNTDHKLKITMGFNTFTFSKSDVQSVRIIVSTSEWVKYLINLKNGKKYVAIFMMTALAEKAKGTLSSSPSLKTINVGVQNFEWWMFDLIYSNQNNVNNGSVLFSNRLTEKSNNEKNESTLIEDLSQKQAAKKVVEGPKQNGSTVVKEQVKEKNLEKSVPNNLDTIQKQAAKKVVEGPKQNGSTVVKEQVKEKNPEKSVPNNLDTIQKQATTKKVEESKGIGSVAAEDQKDTKGAKFWMCKRCGTINPPAGLLCKHCGASK